MKRREFLVELHDLSPARLPAVARLTDLAGGFRAKEPLLMITPQWGGQSSSDADWAHLRRSLEPLEGRAVLHGLTHDVRGGPFERLLLGEPVRAEFARATVQDAIVRLERGRRLLSSHLGASSEWFCAPRWQQSPDVAPALRALGFRGFFERAAIVPLSGPRRALPAVCFDHGTRRLVVFANRLLRSLCLHRLLSLGHAFRLTLHPRDAETPGVRTELERLALSLERHAYRSIPLAEAVALS